MAFVPTYRTNISYKTLSGEKDSISAASVISQADADALALAELKLKSGQAVLSVSQSTNSDPAAWPLGHSDASEEATFVYKVAGEPGEKTETFDEISLAYKNATLNDGTIDMTNGDITAYFAARGTATGKTYVPVKGHYS